MAKTRYQISTWRSFMFPEASEYETRQQLPAALEIAWKQIYGMLTGDGALDTERAHRLLTEYTVFCADCERTKPTHSRRHYFSRNFYLRSGRDGELGAHVKFVAIREH